MADPAPAAAAANANVDGDGQGQQQESRFSSVVSNLRYYLLIFLAFNFISSAFNKQQEPQTPTNKGGITKTVAKNGHDQFIITPDLNNSTFIKIPEPEVKFTETTLENGTLFRVKSFEQAVYEDSLAKPVYLSPIFNPDSEFSLRLYVNDLENVSQTNLVQYPPDVELNNVTIDSKNSQLYEGLQFPLNDNLKNNGSLFLHAYIAEGGNSIENGIWGYKRFQLNNYLEKKKDVKLHKLIGDDKESNEEVTEEEPKEKQIISYWHPNVTIAITKPPAGLTATQSIPPPLLDVLVLDPLERRDNLTGQVAQYYPIVYQNKFWQLKDHMYPINDTLSHLELNLKIEITSFWKTQLFLIFEDGFRQQKDNPAANPLGAMSDGSEIDAIKKILIETNAYLLAITIGVSILHSVLEFLAFKSDISHWRKKKDNVGVSVRSIVANVIQQIITLLYLIDNSEGTSFMILASQGFGILVEAWKITTIVNVVIKWDQGLLPDIKITDKYELSESEQKTQEYDSIAYKYLYWASIPLLISYAVYSLLYKEHKSWYSFIIATLVGFVYTYGFMTLIPSVYINYRLKSVAHVPKKAMAYKVVNTFIDDLFAFVIKMPWLHRLATLRDDVIFVIYLYQCWIYRVDYKRVNEFGQIGVDDEDVKEETENQEKKEK